MDLDMSLDTSHLFQCLACGRKFALSNAYSTHLGSCQPRKKRMGSALELAKETYARKKSRLCNPLPQLQPPLQPAVVMEPIVQVSFSLLELPNVGPIPDF